MIQLFLGFNFSATLNWFCVWFCNFCGIALGVAIYQGSNFLVHIMIQRNITAEQEDAIRAYLWVSIMPLIEKILIKKLGQAMIFVKDELETEAAHGIKEKNT